MKSLRVFLFLLPFIAVIPVGYAAEPAPTVSEPITIGVNLPLTGGYAEWASRISQGLEMAKADARHAFNFVYNDEGPCDNAAKSLSAMQKLLAVNRVHIVISGCLSGTKVVGPIAKQHDVLVLSPGLLDGDVLAHEYPLINFATEIQGETQFLAKLISDAGVSRLAAIRSTDAFSEEVAQTLARRLAERNVKVVLGEMAAQEMLDFRSLLLRVKGAHADALLMNTLGKEQQLALMRQLKELKLNLPVFSNYIIESNTPRAAELKILDGVRYTYPINSADGSADKIAFDRRFEQKFGKGNLPSPNTYFSYDGLMLLDAALNNCAPSDVLCIRRALANGEKRYGLSGEMTINPDGSNARPYGFKQVKDGRFEWLQRDVPLN